MKIIKYFCDFCGRDLTGSEVGTITSNRGRTHYNHGFSFHICTWCYPDFVNKNIFNKLIEERKENARRCS